MITKEEAYEKALEVLKKKSIEYSPLKNRTNFEINPFK